MTSHNERRTPWFLLSVALLLAQACAGRVENSLENLQPARNTGGASGVAVGLSADGSVVPNNAGGAYALPTGGALSNGGT